MERGNQIYDPLGQTQPLNAPLLLFSTGALWTALFRIWTRDSYAFPTENPDPNLPQRFLVLVPA